MDSLRLPESTLNLLFAALSTTAIGAFLGGNLLLLDLAVLQRSGQIALACLALLLIFYTLAHSLGSVTWGLVLTYGLILVVTYGRQPWLTALVYVFAAGGFLYALRFLRVARRQWGLVLLMGISGTATALANFLPPDSFDILDRLHAGDVHTDALAHASAAAMIKHYGIVSSGLHGLVETPYHALFHRLMAGLSRLSGCGVFEVYGVVRWVLFLPILIFGVVACCAMLDREGGSRVPIAWGLVCIFLVGAPLLLSPWLVWNIYLVSGSYMVSLGLFLLGLPLLFKARLVIPDLLLALLLAALIADAKLSVGLIYAGLWLTRSLFVPGEAPAFERIATLAVVMAVAFATMAPIDANVGTIAISPLQFIRISLFGSQLFEAGAALLVGSDVSWRTLALALLAVPGFFVFHFLPSWLLIGWVAYHRGTAALPKDPVALYALAAVIAGALVALLFSLPAGSVYYFSNVAFFVALPVLVALLTRQLDRRRMTGTVVLLFGILVLVGSSWRVYYHVVNTRLPVSASRPRNPFIESLLQVRDTLPINVVMKADPTAVVKDNPARFCAGAPLLFPAVSERPWIGVMPVRDDCRYPRTYTYGRYGITDSQQVVTVKPRLLPGMRGHHWPLAPQDADMQFRVLQNGNGHDG